jgi:hypothetical protein
MESLFELDNLGPRRSYVERSTALKPEATRFLEEVLVRGQFERGESARIAGLPDRPARRILADAQKAGLLGSEMPKGPVSRRFPTDALDALSAPFLGNIGISKPTRSGIVHLASSSRPD